MTQKSLIIAEKPSVASDIAKVLPGKFKREKTHFEGDKYIISYAVGHLVSICYPEEIDSRFQKWDMANLPILPEEFPLKGLDGTKTQLNALQKLIRRKDVGEIINACDAGREGELIFKYIVKFVWNNSVAQKSFKRLWLQSMTPDAIRSAFQALRNNDEMQPLEDTALCRSESDWLIGINATRALTGYNSRKGGFFLTPCGRVQTPTLSLLVKRERIRLDFVPRSYWTLTGTFGFAGDSYEGKWIDTKFQKDPKDPDLKWDRLWQHDQALTIIAECKGKPATIKEESKESRQSPPPLYDLTLLQREANSRFGFSAKNTLALAQALYERHKVLTYPRTDSKHLPEDYLNPVKELLDRQTHWQYAAHAKTALAKKYVKNDKRIFNNAKISDHHAIIPTNGLPTGLSEPEMKIYQMVVQRFIAVFFPPAVYLNTKRQTFVANHTFLTEGKILLDAGWRAVYGTATDSDKDSILAPIPKDASITCSKVTEKMHETTPPPRFNESTLLSAMENSDKLVDDEDLADAMKERGLGTPATRAAIIEKLIKEKYVVRDGKDLAPTGKAFELLALLEAMHIEVLASPEMTGEWEYKLNQILKGDFTRDQFMQEIRNLTRAIIDKIRGFKTDDNKELAPFSPIDGIKYYSTPTAYISDDGKTSIRKILGGRVLSEDEIVALIKGETIGPFDNFRSKKGKAFTASVRLVNNKVDFIFADSNNNLDIDAIKKGEILGKSPKDGTPVFMTPAGYMSESALDGNEQKGLRISRIILSREIEPKHIRQMLSDSKTELITGFISKRKKPFDAYLVLDKNGTVSFEFPPRKQGKKTKQSQAPSNN